jgi:hypothetical protein
MAAITATVVGMTAEQAARPRARRRERHPLLGGFPLSVLTLATFVVVFAILTARLQGGADPALRASTGASSSVMGEEGPGGRIVTRSSGASSGHAGALAGAAAPRQGEGAGAVRTRASGSRGEESRGEGAGDA